LKTVLYADVLFLINFGMDLISLWLTLTFVHQSTGPIRLLAASTVGGVYGVVSVIFSFDGLLSIIISILISALMIRVGAKGKITAKKYIKYTFILWGIGALAGGVVTVVCTLGEGSVYGFRAHNAPFFVLALASAVTALIVRAFSSLGTAKKCDAEISAFGTTEHLSLLVDSGNFAKEPISGTPVIFIKKNIFIHAAERDINLLCSDVSSIEYISSDIKRRARVVTVERVGEKRAMISFFPDSVIIRSGKDKRSVACSLVIEDVENYQGFDGILPASLLK